LAFVMSTSVLLFVIVACWTGLSALAVLFSRNVVRAAVWLLFTLIGVTLLYFLLGADFLGASQLIVYVGGTLVLVIFGVMLTAQGPFLKLRTPVGEWAAAGLLAASLFGLLVYMSLQFGEPPVPRETLSTQQGPAVGVGALGLAFLNVREVSPPAWVSGFADDRDMIVRPRMGYLLPFEIVSVHLLVVLVGAAYLARAKRRRGQTAVTQDEPAVTGIEP
jgi:NADH-quinone oxidoreductase subunit J